MTFQCTSPACGAVTEVWVSKCTACGAYNSFRGTNGAGGGGGLSLSAYGQPNRQAPTGPRILNTKNAVLSKDDEFVHTPCGMSVIDTAMAGGVVLGKSGVGTSILFIGAAGTGKTSTCLGWLAGKKGPGGWPGLCNAEHRGVYLTAEQEGRAVLATAKLFGFESEYVDIVEIPRGETSLHVADQVLQQTGAKIAVYDSIQKMKKLAGDIERPLTRILISRLNKFGEAFGEREQEHDPDTLLWAEYVGEPGPRGIRKLYTSKNRHGQLNEALYTMENEQIVPWSEKKERKRKS